MKENLIDDNIITNYNTNEKHDKVNNRNNNLINNIVEMSNQTSPKKSSKIINKAINQIKKVNKLHRYKIGLIFYIIYLIIDMVELILTILTEYDYKYDPFCETYLRFGAFTIFLLIAPFVNKGNSSLFDMMNITKYYIPDW